ncbi:AfsR/SARP family transcriptional regulator [Catenuloplanes atrovinosus]|uniref:DNA-binding SARP family transcriptional activator/tetratricopeptide (TPR) repeat protein n=1 Tax=Catenuloplanes atrovinosus TaxID=137266 RepID=A0AAE3YQ47_9ACTN|nr:BTAD domain-containing putative transcriptional regulator [Catenuloplanes atrovinosus]MDR7276378.1 DNA-binding SARP family transcriptional activator/tetratricopeptide (TPR) repeat protein [Catenuloplanes atrovinosus]
MWLQVLGPVRGRRDDVELELGPPQQRTLLAVLLAAAGEPVGVPTILDVLWGDAPPAAAAATVQQYVSRLRKIIEPDRPARDQGGLLRRTAGGYQLAADTGQVDLLRWRALIRDARELYGADKAAAGAMFREAFALWTGPAAANLPPEAREHPVFTGLDREHVTTLVEAADDALSCGYGPALVPALDRAAVWHPFDEGVHARLLRALAAAGRRADAMRRYREVRDRLVDELGIEPGPLLQAAHRELLAEPEPEPAPVVTEKPQVVRPAQLPADLGSFSGRDVELDRLDSLAEGAMPLVVVGGLGGVGKTALALRWAHRVMSDYPDGQLYVDLRGFAPRNPPLPPVEALHGFLEALGVPRANQPSTLDGLSALYRSVLAGRKILVVLDNARDDEQVRPLLPGTAGCAVVVTSRSYLGGLAVDEGARSVGLDVFSDADAYRYLRSRLGKERVDAEPEAAAEIIEVCGGLPLALAICAAWTERSPAFTLGTVAAEIRRRAGLDAFAGVAAGRDVRAVFSWSYRRLTPGAAELFRRLGLHPGGDVALGTVASIAGRRVPETLALLAELADAHLISELRPGRYGAHDLVRAYAAELGEPAEREETLRRTLDHYLHSLLAGAQLVNPLRAPIDAGRPADGVRPLRPRDTEEALAWFGEERENIRAAMDSAEQHGLDPYLWYFSWGLNGYLMDQLGRWDEVIPAARRALAAAERQNSLWWRGYLHNALGICHHRFGDYAEAYRQWSLAAQAGRESDDPVRTGIGLAGMASTLTDTGRWPTGDEIERAAALADEAVALCGHLDSDAGPLTTGSYAARARELLGICTESFALRILHRTGDVEAAAAEMRRGIELHRSIGNWAREGWSWELLGRIYQHVGKDAEAIEAYERGLALMQRWQWSGTEVLVSLAACHARLGDRAAAARLRARARRLADGVYHAYADQLRARLDAYEAAEG